MAATRKHISVALGNNSTLPLVRLQICCLLGLFFFLSSSSRVEVLRFCSAICGGRRVKREKERENGRDTPQLYKLALQTSVRSRDGERAGRRGVEGVEVEGWCRRAGVRSESDRMRQRDV